MANKRFGNYIIRSDGQIVGTRNKFLKQETTKRGYLRVTICSNGITKRYLSHRLIAKVFISNPKNKPQVNHKNGIKNDNRVDNLEWVTPMENVNHCLLTQLQKVKGVDNAASKLTEKQVRKIRKIGKTKKRYELAAEFGVSKTMISNIINLKNWKHLN